MTSKVKIKMREEFEDFAKGKYVLSKNDDLTYYVEETAEAWDIWQSTYRYPQTITIERKENTPVCEKMREEFKKWAASKDMPLRQCRGSEGQYWDETTHAAWEAWRAACAPRVAEEAAVEEFFERYNSAINNPAPDDDGGTTSYELERLLDEAVLLLEKLA